MPVCVYAVCLFYIGSFCVNDAIFQHADLMFVLTASAATAAAGFANSRTISRKINCTHTHTHSAQIIPQRTETMLKA